MPNDQGDDWLALSDPDIGTDEMEQALLTLRSPQLSMGPKVAEFEGAFAAWVGRPQGVAVSSGTLGACLLLKAWGVGAGDVKGPPADGAALRSLADRHGLKLLEDSTEAIGSRYQGRHVGTFGDAAVFDFSHPSALCPGQGR